MTPTRRYFQIYLTQAGNICSVHTLLFPKRKLTGNESLSLRGTAGFQLKNDKLSRVLLVTLKLCNLLLKTNISFSLKHPLKTWYDTALLHVLSLNTEIPSSVLPAVRLCYFGHHILATSLFVSTFHTSTANLFLTGRLELSSQVLLTFSPSSPLHCELFNNPSMLIITSC